MMQVLFLWVLKNSISALPIIALVLVARVLMTRMRAPKRYSYALWAVVGFRFMLPAIPISAVGGHWGLDTLSRRLLAWTGFQRLGSVFAREGASVASEGTAQGTLQGSGVNALSLTPSVASEAAVTSVSQGTASPIAVSQMAGGISIEMLIAVISWIWVLGVIGLLAYGALTYRRLNRRLQTVPTWSEELGTVYVSAEVQMPFLMGLWRPRIYLPEGLSAIEKKAIMLHESAHIARGDHLLKYLACVIVAFHWFNPLAWISFYMMVSDMEMSCDEAVLRSRAIEPAVYSEALLSLASLQRTVPLASPAFGESAVGRRIKNALKYTSSKPWVAGLSLVLCGVIMVACGTNGTVPEEPAEKEGMAALFGTYAFEKTLYWSPLSSQTPPEAGAYFAYHEFKETELIITKVGETHVYKLTEYKPVEVDEDVLSKYFVGEGQLDASKYVHKAAYQPMNGDAAHPFIIYHLDDDIWIAHISNQPAPGTGKYFAWSVFKLTPYTGNWPPKMN